MNEKILTVLESARGHALTIDEIFKKTGLSENLYSEFLEYFEDLQNNKKIYCTNSKKGLYTLNPYVSGTIHMRRNETYYVTLDNGNEVNIDNPMGAMDQDKVLVKITDFTKNEATIKEITERHGLVAELKTIDGTRYAVTNDKKYKIDVPENIVDGMLIGIKIDKTKAGKFYGATLDKVLCHKNSPKVDERKLFYEFEVPVDFSKEALEEARNLPSNISEEDIKGRRDLRDKMIFTIDGDDTKDIDDAVSVDILPNGNYKLGVHIADVSHYVKQNSYLDLEAMEKGNSYYMPGIVNPMYPPELSNGICSLNPDVDRLALSCEMEIDETGKIVDYDIFESVIHSRKQMTYKNVNKVLNENIIPEGYEEYADKLKEMGKLAKILRKRRSERGMIDFDRPEIKIIVDENGNVLEISKRIQDTGENLIEDFMLEANECVATHMSNLNIPFIYRVEGSPDDKRLKEVINLIKTYGVEINNKLNLKDPKVIQKLLDNLKEVDNFDIWTMQILRCMDKAKYLTENEGHFAVAIQAALYEAYCHFTSPIRRYEDTTDHRIIKKVLHGDLDLINSSEFSSSLTRIAEKCSTMERIADKLEKEANKMKMADYMSEYLGTVHSGRIESFTTNAMYVELDNLIEGRVGYNTMDDYYTYDETLGVIVGKKTKKVYRLGDRVEIKVVRADKEAREIDFEMVRKRKR